jgi:two-component system nitrogen regulation sensor histidine kinase NtrY
MQSLKARSAAAMLLVATAAVVVFELVHELGQDLGITRVQAAAVTAALTLGLALWLAGRLVRPLHTLSLALDTLLLCWRDGDYATHLSSRAELTELRELAQAHSQLAQAIRAERHQLAQREWLLDTVVQHTPIALVLLDAADQVLVANLAARSLLGDGRKLQGRGLAALLQHAPAQLATVLAQRQEGVISLGGGDDDAQWLVSQKLLVLQGQPLRLLLLRPLTRELARQEVAAWKRVLRVLSHELNNSLAPMQSMAHSGAELSRRVDQPQLAQVFERIEQRARHLHGFLAGYAQFAKLPAPQRQPIAWADWVDRLRVHERGFVLDGQLPADLGDADPGQLEQAVLNLLTNAHESGSPPEAVSLRLRREADEWQLSVADRGPGVSDAVLAQALLPFYSTKRGGTGLGLALAREIAEAHGGRLELRRRGKGGLRATLSWPAARGTA